MNILITGVAGFIGYHLAKSCIKDGHNIIGIDNINDYYDQKLKFARLKKLGINSSFSSEFNKEVISNKYNNSLKFYRTSIEDKETLEYIFKSNKVDVVCNLAAQAGVRYSLINPGQYIQSNVVGFVNICEMCKQFGIKKFIYASSSSVYGDATTIPFSEDNFLNKPISLYAATKLSNELIAYTYSHLYKFETIGLRFFTVYGPWGRPDMALFLFTKAILENETINVFNNGELYRDFTYIDDIIEGLKKTVYNQLTKKNKSRVYNIGRGKKIKLLNFISLLEDELSIKANKNFQPKQPGDVYQTYACCKKLNDDYGYLPNTDIKKGVKKFINWYKKFYEII